MINCHWFSQVQCQLGYHSVTFLTVVLFTERTHLCCDVGIGGHCYWLKTLLSWESLGWISGEWAHLLAFYFSSANLHSTHFQHLCVKLEYNLPCCEQCNLPDNVNSWANQWRNMWTAFPRYRGGGGGLDSPSAGPGSQLAAETAQRGTAYRSVLSALQPCTASHWHWLSVFAFSKKHRETNVCYIKGEWVRNSSCWTVSDPWTWLAEHRRFPHNGMIFPYPRRVPFQFLYYMIWPVKKQLCAAACWLL